MTVSISRLISILAGPIACLAMAAAPLPGIAQAAAPAADFVVSPAGDDAGPGTADKPFATLARARDAVRLLLPSSPPRGVTVLIRGGHYALRETVVFGLADSAPEGTTVTYAAWPGEAPVFSSAVPIGGWRRTETPPAGLPEVARGKVWEADASAFRDLKITRLADPLATVTTAPLDRVDLAGDPGAWRFFTLYDGGRRLPRARGAGFASAERYAKGQPMSSEVMTYPAGAIRAWTRLADAELLIIPGHNWAMNILPFRSVDEAGRSARFAQLATYPLGRNQSHAVSAWVENAIELLSAPGQWVLDTAAARVYYWPAGGEPGDAITAPLLTELVRVEGAIDYDGPRDTPVRGLVFRGLTFTQGERFRWAGRTGWGLQHDWERFDFPTALVRFRGAEQCALEDCRFVDSGGTGVRFDLHSAGHRVIGCEFARLGAVGVLMAGYGPGHKDVNRGHRIENNHIHHTGELYWGSPAIFAWQSGANRIAHNLIHHAPYTCIVVSGRIIADPKGYGECSRTVRWAETGREYPKWPWTRREPFLHGRDNRIEFNEIHDAMEICGDGNGIYVSGTGGGNLVKGNFVHDSQGLHMNAGIRCDDDQHGATLEGNVICRNAGAGEGIIIKGVNNVINNVIADQRPGPRHRGYLLLLTESPRGAVIQRNILYATDRAHILALDDRPALKPNAPRPRLRDTQADYNLYWNTDDAQWGERHLTEQRAHGIERHSRSADPMFADLAKNDFSFGPDSPAAALGIRPIDVSLAGLQPDYLARLIGRRLTTRIRVARDAGGEAAMAIVECDDPAAAIHYTLDGAAPSADSPRYSAPIPAPAGAVVRAVSFRPGALDLAGARLEFPAAAVALSEGFEDVEPGEMTPGAETSEDTPGRTARVTEERAAEGRRSLKFIDGPGQKHVFNPHVFWLVDHREGRARGAFDVWVGADSQCDYQWRQYGSGDYVTGPSVRIEPGGRVMRQNQEIARIPLDQWTRFEIVCPLGEAANGRFDLTIRPAGSAAPLEFKDQAIDKKFRALSWVGVISNGQRESVFYIDNFELRRLADNEQE